MNRRSHWVYGVLGTAWAVILAWQAAEHLRVRRSAREALINHSKDISSTLGVVMRSQRRWGVISKERCELALQDLVRPGELDAVALLNAEGEVVASAGAPIEPPPREMLTTGLRWADQTVTLMNLVDLGTNVTQETDESRPTIILPTRDRFGRSDTNRPAFPPPPTTVGTPESGTRHDAKPPAGTEAPGGEVASAPGAGAPGYGSRRGPREERRPFGRPPWMSEEDYQTMIRRQGVHSFLVVLSTKPIMAAATQDLWLRSIISLFATVSVIGLGLAWRNLLRSSELEVRLVRAGEMNAHLRGLNVAAAGLAHETRNPLNIIRGLAQMISRQPVADPEVRRQSREIVDETDRVTAQLNEFINYSRPREVRLGTVKLGEVIRELSRALTFDLEEKCIRLRAPEAPPAIEADEQLLRQSLFNLLMNAVQAVERGGDIEVAVTRVNGRGITLEVRDNGPGVPVEQRTEIFKPYFTTHQKGTGLGLAVVQQIVLAHGWEIECLPNEPRGAVFRISHIKMAAGA